MNISYEELLNNMQKAMTCYHKILQHIASTKSLNKISQHTFNQHNIDIIYKILQQLNTESEKFNKINTEYFARYHSLIKDSILKLCSQQMINRANAQNNQSLNNQNILPFIIPDDHSKPKSDNNDYLIDKKIITNINGSMDLRFKGEVWNNNIYFNFIKEYYTITTSWIQDTITQYTLTQEEKQYVAFIVQQFINAVAPSNFASTNPEVIQKTLDTGMENIVHGMENFFADLKKSNSDILYDIFNISTTDKSQFIFGQNIAATAGKVVYQNDLAQLICYSPKKNSYSVPIFIVPPWINKYYILDLSQKNSLVKWLVDNNFQVFLLSWINPSQQHANKDFEDYLQEGILESYKYIQKLGYIKINSMGYCIGGTLLASALSYLQTKGRNCTNSASFLTTLIDFSNPGDISNFITKESLDFIKNDIASKGYLDGKHLANSFSLMKSNELIWSFFVNNYLLGKAPKAFDILYWNSDSSNLPAKMYLYYVNNMYINNKLIQPLALEMLGTKIDISNVHVPSFWLAAKSDHIALWESVYDGFKIFGKNNSDKLFCLTDAGHVAGVINPANSTKYAHMISDKIFDTTDEWINSANKHDNSWWNSWQKWLINKSGKMQQSIDYQNLPYIEYAPGSYVQK